LSGAGFSDANLAEADFSGAQLDLTVFRGASFTSATMFVGTQGTPAPGQFIIVDGNRLEGDAADQWLRSRITPSKAEETA